jgi:hypothetical protein
MPTLRLKRRWGMVFLKPCRDAIAYGLEFITPSSGAVGASVEGAERAAEAAVFPIEGYDEMNVEEISGRLDDLSLEELQLVRDYEELNKRRDTLLEKMDRKIRAS